MASDTQYLVRLSEDELCCIKWALWLAAGTAMFSGGADPDACLDAERSVEKAIETASMGIDCTEAI